MADVWAHCAGAPLLNTMYPDEETLEAKEGTAVHWVVEQVLKSYKPESESIRTTSQFVNCRADNDIIVTDEMTERAGVMISDVLSVCQQHGLLADMHIEEKMMIPTIHRNNGGTPDLWIPHYATKTLYQWDYKDGHKEVPADSWQNINYLAGIKTILGIDGHMDQEWTVVMKIVQPRSYSGNGPIKSHTAPMSDFRAHHNQLAAQAEKAHSPDPGTVAGPHCVYCPAAHHCQAARKAGQLFADLVGTAAPEVMSGEALSFEINMLRKAMKMGKYRLEAAESEALRRLQAGSDFVPGFAAQQSTSTKRKFVGTTAEIQALGQLLNIDLIESKPVTPAEAERRIKALNVTRATDGLDPIDEAVISPYTEKPKGAFKLVEVDASKVVQAFTQAKG